MFSALGQNNVFYILDKNSKPTLKVGKVVKVNTNPQYYGLANQEIDITVDVNGDSYEFKKIPANLSIVSPSNGIVISDNVEDMTREFETMIKLSQQAIDTIDYHRGVIDSKDEILSILNPRFAKEKERDEDINKLKDKMGGIESKMDKILTLL